MTRRLLMGAGASLLLHGLAVSPLLLHPAARGGTEQPPAVEIEFVDQPAERKGAQAAAASEPPPAASAAPAPDTGATPLPQPAAPAPQTQARPGPQAPPAVNLSGADEDQDSLLVTGANVVPPRPDARIHNKPPGYPADAARRGAQGVVGLIVHVTESGLPAWVDVQRTSGDASLDRAARDAVALWRFQPARRRGAPVPFDYEYNIRFTLDGRQERVE